MDEEGLQATKNSRIFIGHPIRMDYQRFEEGLLELDKAAWGETEDIRVLVHNLVPEYHYKKDDYKKEYMKTQQDEQIVGGQCGDESLEVDEEICSYRMEAAVAIEEMFETEEMISMKEAGKAGKTFARIRPSAVAQAFVTRAVAPVNLIKESKKEKIS